MAGLATTWSPVSVAGSPRHCEDVLCCRTEYLTAHKADVGRALYPRRPWFASPDRIHEVALPCCLQFGVALRRPTACTEHGLPAGRSGQRPMGRPRHGTVDDQREGHHRDPGRHGSTGR